MEYIERCILPKYHHRSIPFGSHTDLHRRDGFETNNALGAKCENYAEKSDLKNYNKIDRKLNRLFKQGNEF